MAYYPTETVIPVPMAPMGEYYDGGRGGATVGEYYDGGRGGAPIGEYYDGGRGGSVVSGLGQDILMMPEGGCPSGYHQGSVSAGGASLETPVCVKRSFTALHLGLAALAGLVIGKML